MFFSNARKRAEIAIYIFIGMCLSCVSALALRREKIESVWVVVLFIVFWCIWLVMPLYPSFAKVSRGCIAVLGLIVTLLLVAILMFR